MSSSESHCGGGVVLRELAQRGVSCFWLWSGLDLDLLVGSGFAKLCDGHWYLLRLDCSSFAV